MICQFVRVEAAGIVACSRIDVYGFTTQAGRHPWRPMARCWRSMRGAGTRRRLYGCCRTSSSAAAHPMTRCLTPSWTCACAPGNFAAPCRCAAHISPLHFLRTLVSSNSDSCAPRGKYKGTVLVIRFAQIFTMLCSPEQNHEGILEDWY